MFTPRRSRQPSMRRKQRYFHWCSPRRGARHRFPMLRRAGHSRNQSRELTAISDKDTKGCRFVSFCTLAGFMKMSVKSLFRMAGTTRLELATSAVTVVGNRWVRWAWSGGFCATFCATKGSFERELKKRAVSGTRRCGNSDTPLTQNTG